MSNQSEPKTWWTPNRRWGLAWILVGLWALFIFFMSANTGEDLAHGTGIVATIRQYLDGLQQAWFGTEIDMVSPVAHFLEYTVFGLLLAYALGLRMGLAQSMVLAIVIASCYGVTDEFHQYFVPGRTTDVMDGLVDTIGAALGAAIYGHFRFHGLPGRKKQD